MNQGYCRQVLECAGRAQRRGRFQTRTQSGVAPAGAGLPPQSKNHAGRLEASLLAARMAAVTFSELVP
jgi:hypothetical protein